MKQRILSAFLSLVLTLGLCSVPLVSAQAVSLEELESAALIGEREPTYSSLCLVYACWYMARRRVAIERGLEAALATNVEDYRTASTLQDRITVIWDYVWYPTADLELKFSHARMSYADYERDISDLAHEDDYIMQVTGGININSGMAGTTDPDKLLLILLHLLETHPEGIAIRVTSGTGSAHAVLVVGYDETTGLLHIVDPINGGPSMSILSKNYLYKSPPTRNAETQSGILRYVESIWYVDNGDPEKSAAVEGDPKTFWIQSEDEPALEEPAPAEERPAPVEETPAPVEETPAPETPVSEPPAVKFEDRYSYTEGQFSDVFAESWFSANVRRAYELGLMRGVGEGCFFPEGTVSLAETIIMAARVHSIYATGSDEIPGVSAENWYYPYRDYALAHGILPEDLSARDASEAIDRLSFSRIFAAALPADALPAVNVIPDGAIPDVAATDPWADAVYLLYRAGILVGNETGHFLGGSTITRAEAAAIVSRMADSNLRIPVALG